MTANKRSSDDAKQARAHKRAKRYSKEEVDAMEAQVQKEDAENAQKIIRRYDQVSHVAKRRSVALIGQHGNLRKYKTGKTISKSTGVVLDEHGRRVLTVNAIRKEVWRQRGSITVEQLMKVFGVERESSTGRHYQFRKLVREICKVEQDPAKGNMLVLRQYFEPELEDPQRVEGINQKKRKNEENARHSLARLDGALLTLNPPPVINPGPAVIPNSD